MRSLMVSLCAAAVAVGALGCDGGDGGGDDYEIAEGTLSGKIGGQDWKFASGWTDDFLSDEEGYFTSLYDVEAEACSFGGGSDRGVLLNVPKKVGEYELSFNQNVTLFSPGADGSPENNVATTGKLVVEKVSDTEVEVGLYAIFGDGPDNEVSGHFTAAICPPTP